MRVDGPARGGHASTGRVAAGNGPDLAQLIAELASAGLVSLEVTGDGDVTCALTARGQRTALLMAMSRQPYALVLLGALMGTSETPG